MRNKAQALAMMGLGLAMLPPEEQEALLNFDPKKKPTLYLPYKEPQPRGTREYFFNSSGEFAHKMLRTETIFSCYAINDKNAKRKFTNWQKLNCK